MRNAEVKSAYIQNGRGAVLLAEANTTVYASINERTSVYILQSDGTAQLAQSVAITVGQHVDLLINATAGILRSSPAKVTADEILIR